MLEGTPLDLRLSHGKIGINLRYNPWAVGWSPEGTLMELRSLNFTAIYLLGKYLGCVESFPQGGVQEALGPLM